MLKNMMAGIASAAAIGALALAGASSAQASLDVGTTTTPLGSGSMAVSATAPSSRLTVAGLALNCTTTSGSASVNTGNYVAPFPKSVGTIQPIFGGGGGSCTGPAGFEFTVTCVNTSNLNITSDTPTSPGTFPGSITNISCEITFPAVPCTATVTGSVVGSYTNPTATTDARLTVFAAGQSLTVSNSTCPSFVLPNGAAQYGGTGGTPTTVTDLTYTLGGATDSQPYLTHTS